MTAIVETIPSAMSAKKDFIEQVKEFEDAIGQLPGAVHGDAAAPLKHSFGEGLYVREITMPKGWVFTSKIHKKAHPYFVMRGECSVKTETGTVRLKAGDHGMTEPGTKRVLYIQEECVWVTVHATQETELKEIEKDIMAEDYHDLLEHTRRREALS